MDRPMLAASYRDGDFLSFPLLATPKIDGVRALIIDGKLVSRSFKPIPNVALRQTLEAVLPEGADGEITCGRSLYDTTSIVMSRYSAMLFAGPSKKQNFTFSWFDWAYDLKAPYEQRVSAIVTYPKVDNIVPLVPEKIHNIHELKKYETKVLGLGYEGVVVRAPQGRYKCGRSTLKEGLMIKIKRTEEYEAVIVGTEELMHNMNEQQTDNFGNTKRSSAVEHLVPGDTLGAIVADLNGMPLRIGTGFTADQRDALWANRDIIAGKFAKYKCAEFGKNGLPRSPVFTGIRHDQDM